MGRLGGSLASVGWRFLEKVALGSGAFAPFDPRPVCPLGAEGCHLDSSLLGLGLGLALGPLVDLVYLFRVWWVTSVCERVSCRAAPPASVSFGLVGPSLDGKRP